MAYLTSLFKEPWLPQAVGIESQAITLSLSLTGLRRWLQTKSISLADRYYGRRLVSCHNITKKTLNSEMYSSIAAFRGTQVVQGDTDRSRESYPNSSVHVAWRYLPINQLQRYLDRILIFDSVGNFITAFGQFGCLQGIAIDKSGLIYALNTDTTRRHNTNCLHTWFWIKWALFMPYRSL